jgi:hypothetical protein
VEDGLPRARQVRVTVERPTARHLARRRVRVACGRDDQWQGMLQRRWPRDARRTLRTDVDRPLPPFDICRLERPSGAVIATIAMLRAE